MTAQPLTRDARTARRQTLLDRFTEIVAEAGAPYPDALATRLRDVVDELGFDLPAALQDAPPPPDRTADPDHRKACMDEIRAVFHRDR